MGAGDRVQICEGVPTVCLRVGPGTVPVASLYLAEAEAEARKVAAAGRGGVGAAASC